MDISLDTLRGFFKAAPFMVDLGVEATGVSPGKVSTELVLQPRHLQHTGVVHAGVMAAMADHSMGAAAQTMTPEGHWILTTEFKTNLLRGARGQTTEKLVCEAWMLKPGKQIMFTEAEVFAVSAEGERQLVVKASGTMAVTKAA